MNQHGEFIDTIAAIALPLLSQSTEMKHAHKYMLVPVEPESKPVQLKETLRTVLKSGQKDHKTAKKYSHLLRNYLHYKKNQRESSLTF